MSTQDTTLPPLDPCPWCGSLVIAREGFHMSCMHCGADGPDGDKATDEHAAEAWNNRAAIAAQAQQAYELSNLIEADEMLREIGVMLAAQTRYQGSYAEIVRQLLSAQSEQAQQAQGVPQTSTPAAAGEHGTGYVRVRIDTAPRVGRAFVTPQSGEYPGEWNDGAQFFGVLAAAPQAEPQPELSWLPSGNVLARCPDCVQYDPDAVCRECRVFVPRSSLAKPQSGIGSNGGANG